MLLLLGLIAAYYLPLFVHELGHLIAGWRPGYRFLSLSFGPVELKRTMGGLHLRRRKSLLMAAVFMAPRYGRDSVSGMICQMAGGSVASMLLVGVAVAVSRSAGASEGPARGAAVWSLILAVVNLIPMTKCGWRSDGAVLAVLIRGGTLATRLHALYTLSMQQLAGQHPGDYDEAVLRDALAQPDGSVEHFAALTFAYARELWFDRFSEAGELLDELLGNALARQPPFRDYVLANVALFTVKFTGDPVTARTWLFSMKKYSGPRHGALYLEAELLLAEGRREEARAEPARSGDCPDYLAEEYDKLIARAEGTLEEPAREPIILRHRTPATLGVANPGEADSDARPLAAWL